LKNSLLKRFRLTEGDYRKRFKCVMIEVCESAEQFVDRLKKYLTKWREMAGFDATYEGLQNMILRDQIFITCDKPLQTFLKEKVKLNLKEMTQAANNYVKVHGHEINRSATTQNRWNKSSTLSVIRVGSPGCSSSGSVPGISSRFILGYMKASGDSTPIMLSLPSRQPIFVSSGCMSSRRHRVVDFGA